MVHCYPLKAKGNFTRFCTLLLGVILLLADYPWCNDTWFRCLSGVCINVTLTCDNVTDCPDGSDEDKEYAQCKYSSSTHFIMCIFR